MASLDFKSIMRELRAQGWALQQTNASHWRCTPPDPTKPIVHVSGEGGDHRSIRNSLAELRRSGFVWDVPPSSRTTQAEPEAPTLPDAEALPESAPRVALAPPPAPEPEEPDLDALYLALKDAKAYLALARAQALDAERALARAADAKAAADAELGGAGAQLQAAKAAFDAAFSAQREVA